MSIIIKPLAGPNPNTSPNRRTDGFDHAIPYQMIPVGGTREMGVQTGDFKAEMSFTRPDISSMSNFRMLSATSPKLFPLPGPGEFVNRIALPERSLIQFTLSGRVVGITTLEGRDRPIGAPLLKPDFKLQVSVLPSVTRKVATVYAFDRINRDRGTRIDMAGHLASAHKVFHDQANFTIDNIDGRAASSGTARKVTLNGSMGKAFELLNKKVLRLLIQAIESAFPRLFIEAHCVIIPVPLPIVLKGKAGITGVNLRLADSKTQRIFNTLIIGTQRRRPPAKQGGTQPTPSQLLQNTVAHELGHSLGLKLHPSEEGQLPPKIVRGDINPEFFKPDFHNLMFPDQFIVAERLNGVQVEILHEFHPPFRTLEF
jgi:hypothetical protein